MLRVLFFCHAKVPDHACWTDRQAICIVVRIVPACIGPLVREKKNFTGNFAGNFN